MGFTGSAVYEIVPYQVPTLSMNAWEGKMEPGAPVKTYGRGNGNPSTNTLWQVALVTGSGDSAEYLIINVRTGYFLTVSSDKGVATTPQISPTDPSCCWVIKSRPANGYDVYTITSKVSSRGQLGVANFSTQSGAEIVPQGGSDADNCRWYFDERKL